MQSHENGGEWISVEAVASSHCLIVCGPPCLGEPVLSDIRILITSLGLVGCLESSVTLFFATAAIAALKKLDVGPAMPAFFRLALTTVAVKSLLPNFPHSPLVHSNRILSLTMPGW